MLTFTKISFHEVRRFVFFTHSQMLALYKCLVRPCMEYACHVIGVFPYMVFIGVESKSVSLINSLSITHSSESFTVCHSVAFLSIFQHYVHVFCSSELVNCTSPPFLQSCKMGILPCSHGYSVHFPNKRVNKYH